ncbi:MAG: GntR family transcriptional regulator [Acetobacteraceae bacterium]
MQVRFPPNDRRLTKSALSVRAYEMLQVLILNHDIEPGTRLGIDVLAVQLGISQTPIREALARLEGDGLAERNAKGRYHAAPRLDVGTFDQLYEVRLALEPPAAAAAATYCTAAEMLELQAHVKALRTAGTQAQPEVFAGYIAADAAFHEGIAIATHNQFFADAVHHLHVHYRLGSLYRNRGVRDASVAIREHAAICKAISARNADAAALLMRQHIERSRSGLRPSIEADSPQHDEAELGGRP